VHALAASISFALVDSKKVILRAIGASAVSQMVKAAAIARQYVASRGVDLVARPGFQTMMLPSLDKTKRGALEETTAVILVVRLD
jgi:stage V sporulation protein SpoVS